MPERPESLLYVSCSPLFWVERLRRHMQYPVHVHSMPGSGTEKWIIARGGCDELCHYRFAFATHRNRRDYTRIAYRNGTVCLLGVLVHRFHLIGKYQDPIVKSAQKAAGMMERDPDQCAGGAGQRVRP